MSNKDLFELSDEDFLEAGPPEEIDEIEEEVKEDEDTAESEDVGATVESDNEEGETESDSEEPPNTEDSFPFGSKKEGEPATKEVKSSEIDYEDFYSKVMTPFKANGKTIELKSADEAIQLMQMGANYTRKMQSLAPQRKTLMMLENNGLLDEDKLAFLIDLHNKDADAIQKYLKDANIDPLDIDTSAESTYTAGNHRVTDAEVALTTVLEDVGSTPAGNETIQMITKQWDQASKEVLWKEPEILNVIHQQRESGIYQAITDEIERQKLLGNIPATTPFIEAYRTVGSHLSETGGFSNVTGKRNNPSTLQTTGKPKSKVRNSDRARAASQTKSVPVKGTKSDPLNMSDDEFIKYMEGRV